MEAIGKGLSLTAYSLLQVRSRPDALEQAKRYIYERLADGRFKPKVAKTFSLPEAQEAYRYLESNQQVGKIVITVGKP